MIFCPKAPFLLRALLAIALMSMNGALANDEQDDFGNWLQGFRIEAQHSGISAPVLDLAFDNVRAPLQSVLDADSAQPEFTHTFWTYIARALSPKRTQRARRLRVEISDILGEISARHNIPSEVILAFWGLETNFGDYLGKLDTFHALATLAHDKRRRKFFTGELLHALELLQSSKLPRAQFNGSWAGAMGHMQFMPSTMQRYALDGNNNQQIDVRNEIPDALHSAGNFLHAIGWNSDHGWGCEVTLPAKFDYAKNINKKVTISHWLQTGITLPAQSQNECKLPRSTKAKLLLPAGADGPKFLVFDNFDVILRWNRSNFYALGVGILSDRIASRKGMISTVPDQVAKWDRKFIIYLQSRLNVLGFDAGEADGIMGSKTRKALQNFQIARALPADGYPGNDTIALLRDSD